jgi:hypothetical protein
MFVSSQKVYVGGWLRANLVFGSSLGKAKQWPIPLIRLSFKPLGKLVQLRYVRYRI